MRGIGVALTAGVAAIAGLVAYDLAPEGKEIITACVILAVLTAAAVARRLRVRDEESAPEIRSPVLRSEPPCVAASASGPRIHDKE